MARLSTLARFEVSGEILSEDTVALLAAADCKLAGAEIDAGDFAAAWDLLSDEWQRIRQQVSTFDTERLRKRWILPLLELMGHDPQYLRSHTTYAEDRTIPLTHRAADIPLWLLDYDQQPDEKLLTGRRRNSPHELFQEYLDLTADDWGILCNGRTIRLLHDYHKTLTRNYVEADLESIFDALDVDAFRAVWRIFRAPGFTPGAKGVRPIEKLCERSRQEGAEIGKELRKQVLEALRTLGNGFLAADRTGKLQETLLHDPNAPMEFYQALLRVVYRLLFLLYIENKPGWTPAANPVWASSYSITRLREQAEENTGMRADGEDHWEGLKVVFGIIRDGSEFFDIHPYGGELFADGKLWRLQTACLRNSDLLRAIQLLTVFERNKQPYRVNFRTLRIDALGSVYEALLDVAPVITPAGLFTFAEGTDRKLTGSYYTPPELVAELIKSALVPVIEDRLKEVFTSLGFHVDTSTDQPNQPDDLKTYRPKTNNWLVDALKEAANGTQDKRLQRPAGVATSNETGEGLLSADAQLSAGGAIRSDLADSAGSGLHSSQYRRGQRTRNAEGFHQLPENSDGQSSGIGDSSAPGSQHRSPHPTTGPATTPTSGVSQQAPVAADQVTGGRSVGLQVDRSLGLQVDRSLGLQVHESTGANLQTYQPTDLKTSLEAALLAIKVVDPACGSGAFLVQALDKLSEQLCLIRKEGEEPSELDIREARRDVVTHCIHGVDLNPMAVELCKFTLWLHVAHPKLPLSYLEPRIKCGNALIGVPLKKQVEAAKAKMAAEKAEAIKRGDRRAAAKLEYVGWPDNVPDEAFEPVTGDDKAVAKRIKDRNKKEREQAAQTSLDDEWLRIGRLADWFGKIHDMPEDTIQAVRDKSEAYAEFMRSQAYEPARFAADTWCAAFFWPLDEENEIAPTTKRYREIEKNPHNADYHLRQTVKHLAELARFFHWELEFPAVFVQGGFDCVLGNPPWERIKLQEEEFFASQAPEIAAAVNKAARQRLIDALPNTNSVLALAFEEAKHAADADGKFVRQSHRYPLTAVGDVNTYAIFAESFRVLHSREGRAALVCPLGIATDDNTKAFFWELCQKESLISLLGFENEEKNIFPEVHNEFKFGVITMAGKKTPAADFAFYARNMRDASDSRRHIRLTSTDFALLNPNTYTCPVFRTRTDAELTKAVYHRLPVLWDEKKGINPWGIKFLRMFDMANDSKHFKDSRAPGCLPLYEAKTFWLYDHRFASLVGTNDVEGRESRKFIGWYSVRYQDPTEIVVPRYWVHDTDVLHRLIEAEVPGVGSSCNNFVEQRLSEGAGTIPQWFLAFRDITNTSNERSAIFSFIPRVGVGHTAPLLFTGHSVHATACLCANLSSIVFDYVVRQKIGGTHLTYGYIKQLPALPPNGYLQQGITLICMHVLELVYTSWDMKPFAEDMGYDGPPFVWDEDRRAILRAELDAYFARLYGLNRKQLRYILDPHGLSDRELEDILDPWEDPTCNGPHLLPENPTQDFPGETFRVLKNNETSKYGEYRTRRLVLEAWARLEAELGPAKPVNYREVLDVEDGIGETHDLAVTHPIVQDDDDFELRSPKPAQGRLF